MRQTTLVGGLVLLLTTSVAATEVSFRGDVEPILTRYGCNSGACHGAAAGKNGLQLSLRGYDPEWDHAALTRQAVGRRVNLHQPEESLVLKKALGILPHGGGPRFDEGSREHRLLLDWIRAGAPAPRSEERTIESISVTPEETTLAIGAEQKVRVTARYSDGTTRDVTDWAKFGTTNDTVALVDEEGNATIVGHGEAAITAWFQSKITFATLRCAFPADIPPEVYEQSPRQNFVDDFVLEKLERLHLAPSPPATDLEFLRRVFLDAMGILPTPREALAFVASSEPTKREKLLDEILEREEFVDYWTYKLSDLLLLNSRKIKGESLTTFYDFLRRSVAENRPWNEVVREIVTARGSSYEDGAAGYYAIHRDPIDASETTSQAFLGLSITCARCHNHPMEKWTQDQYYGMANLFARVRLKDGERPGELLVLASDSGDLLHPRRGVPMPPQPLDGTALPVAQPGDRREHLAAWLTGAENPYFARAATNRIWKNFFGRGLVDPEDDLRKTNPASNRPLLDALAKNFSDNGFDRKKFIKTIALSAAYQRSSRPHLGNDDDEVFYSHYIVRRLSAEVLLDAYSAVTERPTPFQGYPEGYRALQLRDSEVASYFLKTFGRPDRKITCACERTDNSSLTQVLHLSNGDTLDEKITAEGGVVSRLLGRDFSNSEIIDHFYLAALTRFPTPEERELTLRVVTEAASAGDVPRREALEDVLWGILSSKEFLFNK